MLQLLLLRMFIFVLVIYLFSIQPIILGILVNIFAHFDL